MSTVSGYCWPQSVTPGEVVSLHCSSDSPADATVQVIRDGRTPEVVWTSEPLRFEPHDVTDDTPEQGCAWPAYTSFTVDESWRTGMYLVRIGDSPVTAWFVVRPLAPTPGAALLKLATNTWNAYNDFGGRNLYSGAVEMSTHRPLVPGFLSKDDGVGSRVADPMDDFLMFAIERELSLWHAMAGWANQERRFVLWAEAAGFDLDYAIDADLDRPDGAALLEGRDLLLSVGHDEYWSWGMRDRVEAFVASGGNVAFLSGNTAYWQVRLEQDDRVMVGYKHLFRQDPVMGTDQEHLVTSMWADPLIERPEAQMTGVTFTRGGYHGIHLSVPNGSGGYEVHRPDHWLFDGTAVRRGQLIGTEHQVVAYECDGTELTMHNGVPTAVGSGGTPANFTVLATAPATMFDKDTTPTPIEPDREYELEFHCQRLLGGDDDAQLEQLRYGSAVLGEWVHPSGGTVVTVGCTEWAFGLADPVIARITRNIFARLGNSRGRPANESIANLERVFSSLDALCAELTEEQWKLPTGCPGWSVQDSLSHIIDYEASAMGWPKPFHFVERPDYVQNDLGEANELGVDARRNLPGADVLEEFRATATERVVSLWSILPDDLSAEVMTPAGPGTLATMMSMRVMDCWSHEQDIRRAVNRPGNTDGSVAQESLEYFANLLPFIVGKRAGAPEGSLVRFAIGTTTVDIEVVDGRARRAAHSADATPDVTLEFSLTSFAAHIGGRGDAQSDYTLAGDVALGEGIVSSLAVMP